MRLVCPNCNAQYEVPDDAFGDSGRDVQCSNCEHAWFASPKPAAPATPPAPQGKAQQTSQGKPYPNADAAPQTPQTQPIDPDVQKVLRQEAEQELAARRRRQRRGLKPKPTAAQVAAQQKPAPAPTPPTPAADVAPSHHLLPDVEEINSSLVAPIPPHKSLPTAGPMPAPPRRKHRRAFRVGFLVAILILALLSGPYIFATEIIATFPQVSAPLNQYILVVNEYRQMLYEYSQAMLVMLQNATGSGA